MAVKNTGLQVGSLACGGSSDRPFCCTVEATGVYERMHTVVYRAISCAIPYPLTLNVFTIFYHLKKAHLKIVQIADLQATC